MSGKIIYLENDEEITSVIDRLKHLEEKKIVLVIPRNAAITSSVVSLKLLKKTADELTKDLFLIASDDTSRTLIKRAGLVAYSKIDESLLESPEEEEFTPEANEFGATDIALKKEPQKPSLSDISSKKPGEKTGVASKIAVTPKPEPISPMQAKKLKTKKWLVISVILALLFISAGALAFSLPTAEATITIASEPKDYSETYTVSTNIKAVDSENLAIPGEVVEIEKEFIDSAAATGSKTLGEKASGTIKASNEYSTTPQTLAAGTEFRSSGGLIFRTKSAVTIPGYTDPGGGKVAGQANVATEAANIGAQYNIAAGHFTIPAFSGTPKYTEIYGDSAAAMSGGSSRQAKVVSSKDIEDLTAALEDSSHAAILKELKSNLDKDVVLSEKAIAYSKISATSDKAADTETDTFKVTLKMKGTGITYNQNDLKGLILDDLEKNLEKSQVLADRELKNLVTEILDLDLEKGTLQIKASIEAQIAPEIDTKILKQNIAGSGIQEAEKYLKGVDKVSDAKVRVWPSWWLKSIPVSLSKIQVKIKYQPVEKTKNPNDTLETANPE